MSGRSHPDNIVAAEVELLEAEAWAQMHGAFAQTGTLLAPAVRRYGRATALITPGVDVVAINRVIGLGFEQPLDASQLADINAGYRAAGRSRWFLEWSPSARLREPDVLESAGGKVRGTNAKLFARMTELLPLDTPTGPDVVEVLPEQVQAFLDIVGTGLGVPEAVRPGIASVIGRPGWHYYFAIRDGRPVAGAAMFSDGVGAWFGLTATTPESRGRGAQTALLSRRIADARALGCAWISAETFPVHASDNPSLRNMLRLGLRVLYHRPWYVFEALVP